MAEETNYAAGDRVELPDRYGLCTHCETKCYPDNWLECIPCNCYVCPSCVPLHKSKEHNVKDKKTNYTAGAKVDHPSHYHSGTYEAINVIEAWKLEFCLGNAVKYISRAGHKDAAKEIEDLEKALWYLNRRIEYLKERKLEEASRDIATYGKLAVDAGNYPLGLGPVRIKTTGELPDA